jgi:hypothetical protein
MKNSFAVNASFHKKIKGLEVEVLDGVKGMLEDMAKTAVELSPVDTGAYVTSFSYNVGSGRPRGKSSDNLFKGANLQSKRDEGYSDLLQDISRIKSIEDLDTIQLRNGSPHAYDVEYGENWKKTQGYFVFAKLENIYG